MQLSTETASVFGKVIEWLHHGNMDYSILNGDIKPPMFDSHISGPKVKTLFPDIYSKDVQRLGRLGMRVLFHTLKMIKEILYSPFSNRTLMMASEEQRLKACVERGNKYNFY